MTDADLSQQVLDVIPVAMRFMRSAVKTFQKEGLKFPHYRIIAYLSNHPNASNRELSEWQGVNVATMSRTIDGLVRLGFVARNASSEDRREVFLTLTKKGHQAHMTLRGELRGLLKQRLRGVPDPSKQSLGLGLKILGDLFS